MYSLPTFDSQNSSISKHADVYNEMNGFCKHPITSCWHNSHVTSLYDPIS